MADHATGRAELSPRPRSPSVTAAQDPRSEVLATWTPFCSAQARREPSSVKVGLADVNEAALLAKSGRKWPVLMTAGHCVVPEVWFGVWRVTWFFGALSAGRLVGWV